MRRANLLELFGNKENPLHKVRYTKLQRKKDVENEISYQCKDIDNNDDQIIDVFTQGDKAIIVYRMMYGLDENEEMSIHLKIRAITTEGVIYPEPTLLGNRFDNHITLCDIRIFGDNINKGYGSILIDVLKKLANKYQIKKINGCISTVDIDHLDRLIHFYKKNEFIINGYQIEWTCK